MAKLYLKSEQTVLKEVALSDGVLTIGRLPNNILQIEDSAVSGHHCRIRREADHYVIEDNDSLNGIYVNGEQVFKAILKDGDDILVGIHFLHFEDSRAAADRRSAAPIEVEKPTPVDPAIAPPLAAKAAATAARPARERTGVLTVMDGKTDATKYVLTSKLTMIGKSDMATIKLKGWFAPKVAANLIRREAKYIIASADKDVKISINGQSISGQHELNDGDSIDVAGFKFQFALQDDLIV